MYFVIVLRRIGTTSYQSGKFTTLYVFDGLGAVLKCFIAVISALFGRRIIAFGVWSVRAVEACWRAMNRAVRNYEAFGVIRGQKAGCERNCTSGA